MPEVKTGEKLSATQRARIERNRQRALLLKQSRLTSRPYTTGKEDNDVIGKVKVPGKVIDTGGGFLLEEEDQQEAASTVKIAHPPAPVISTDLLICNECSKEFMDSFLYSHFEEFVCDKCRDNEEKHSLITKTDAKNKYLLKDADFDRREPSLRFIVKKNPHNNRWGEMKLYLESQVYKRAMEVWGSEEKIEEAQERRAENREKQQQKKFDKKVQALRKAVRSSLWTKELGNHEHEFGEEVYDEDNDTYNKTCKSCGHIMSYEKM
ncbi:DNA repair protein complementing XP-A cells homolog isoform X2 [Lingula anatina]|uniref:DNA repair protein complementing XP-A cells homolog isoform X2 n=1 Tax=Lingula anatina TaxID=7574 RepID=A0A1S3IZN8_LINAN|nr:DNA repair protein complementing XP-A cells homolog isoform X2 [Lingula anatina]|eukprot:XP_013403478.1 DNA repair protein complementing XP-A cells homolog isoform X2 [Lingula anatina]